MGCLFRSPFGNQISGLASGQIFPVTLAGLFKGLQLYGRGSFLVLLKSQALSVVPGGPPGVVGDLNHHFVDALTGRADVESSFDMPSQFPVPSEGS